MDHMELSFLNLPLENNLYVINTDSNFDIESIHSASATSSSKIGSTQIESFELNIRIIKKSETTKSYRLQFDSNEKFLDLKRKISKLADLSVNEQEWWFKGNINGSESNETSLEKMIEAGHVLSLPLTVLIKNDSTLNEIKTIHDSLTDSNTKIATSNSSSIHFNSVSNVNSKLTPEIAPVMSRKLLSLSFLVTHKTSNKISSDQLVCSSTSQDNKEEEEEGKDEKKQVYQIKDDDDEQVIK